MTLPRWQHKIRMVTPNTQNKICVNKGIHFSLFLSFIIVLKSLRATRCVNFKSFCTLFQIEGAEHLKAFLPSSVHNHKPDHNPSLSRGKHSQEQKCSHCQNWFEQIGMRPARMTIFLCFCCKVSIAYLSCSLLCLQFLLPLWSWRSQSDATTHVLSLLSEVHHTQPYAGSIKIRWIDESSSVTLKYNLDFDVMLCLSIIRFPVNN